MNNLVNIEYKGNRLAAIQNKFELEEPVLLEIVKSDPTQNKKYTEWLVRLYSKDLIKTEDLYKATQYLKVFNRCVEKRLIAEDKRDINKCKSLQDVFNIVEKYIESEEILQNGESEAQTLVFESENWKVHIPKTFKESQVLGSGTQWCTSSSNGEETFNTYNKSGFLIIFLDKNSGGVEGKFQLHLETDQFADYKDSMKSFSTFLTKHPDLHPFMIQHLKQAASELKQRIQDEHFILDYNENIKGLEKVLKCEVYSEELSHILSTSEEIPCNIIFKNLTHFRFDRLKKIGGGADFQASKGVCPKLKDIGGYAYFRGYEGELPKLEKIGGDADFRDSKGTCPELKEIGGSAYFRGYRGELPKLEKIGGAADFQDSKVVCPKLKR